MEFVSSEVQGQLDRLVIESMSRGCVWGLRDAEGSWAVVASNQSSSINVMPFWSCQETAVLACSDAWCIYTPVAIDLEEFLDDWLPGMHADVLMVGVNWTLELEGVEMEPLDLLEEFESEMSG